jgi:hypothetical protein
MLLLLEQDKLSKCSGAANGLEQMADRAAAVLQSTLADIDRAAAPPSGVVVRLV